MFISFIKLKRKLRMVLSKYLSAVIYTHYALYSTSSNNNMKISERVIVKSSKNLTNEAVDIGL